MSNAPARGRFVWFDLNTTDVPKAVKFYTTLLGWKTKAGDPTPGHGVYTHIEANGHGIGGIVALDPKQHAGVPSHWLAYMMADDVDATTAQNKELGGKVLVPAMDIEKVGRFSVLADAQGAVFSPFKPTFPLSAEPTVPAVGQFCWSEHMSPDPAAAAKHYQALFGYGVQEKDMGPMGLYRILTRGEKMTCGIMKQPQPGVPPSWLHYIAVSDVDASTRNAKEIGGEVFMQPMDIPKMGRFSVIADPTGSVVALFQGAM